MSVHAFRKILLTVLLLLGGAQAATATQTPFVVRALLTGNILLTGQITSAPHGQQDLYEVVYLNPDGQQVQHERAVYEPNKLRVLDYALRNTVLGYEAYAQTTGDSLRVRYRDDPSKPLKERTERWGEDDYHPCMFDLLLRRHWTRIRHERSFEFDMMIPQLGASVGMEFVYEGERSLDGEPVGVVVLRPQFGPFRLLLPRTEYRYSLGVEPALRQYTGPSPFPNSREMVEIRYGAPTAMSPATSR